jgi:membrane-associated phospholipid phosphatase
MVTAACAQTPANMVALRGLSPVSTLTHTAAGRAALVSNYELTGSIQSGATVQPLLQSFAEQQQQALRDAFITGANGYQLADGLGTRLGGAYQSLTAYTSSKTFGIISDNIATLFAYTVSVSAADSNSGKYFFANATTNGTQPVSAAAMSVLAERGGVTDIFGKAYHHEAGGAGSDPYGDSRPFQTEPRLTLIEGKDFFGHPSGNLDYLNGPAQDLRASPSYPSGHTTYAYTEALLLAEMLPERFPQEIARAAEYANNRIVLGAHYAMDVLGGRTLALHDVAHLLANDPAYVGQAIRRVTPISDYPAALAAARTELVGKLQLVCGSTITACAADDKSRFGELAADAALYEATQTYGLPVVHPETAGTVEDVAKIAPEAGYLLTAAFPYLTLDQADSLLTATEGPGGGFLDDGSAFGLYSRIDLYAAASRAIMLQPQSAR